MKNLGLSTALLLASASGLCAQVKVEVLLDQGQFLPGESLPVAVRVVNHSGQTLHFGQEAWVTYSMEARDGSIVLKTGDGPMAHDFDVESSRMATQRSDLAPYFNIARPGRYTVTATVRIKDWGAEVTSEPKTFDIIRGTKLWEQEFGMPQSPGAAQGQPEVRKYSLQRATYLRHVRLYFRLTDRDESRVLKTLPIGPIASFSRPQTQLDRQNNLHLLYEDGARSFNYSVFTPQGEVTTRQTYYYTDSGPRLSMDDSGNILVLGGVRRVTPNDLPVTKTSSLRNDLPPSKTP